MLKAIWFAVYAAALTLNVWLSLDPMTRGLREEHRERELAKYRG